MSLIRKIKGKLFNDKGEESPFYPGDLAKVLLPGRTDTNRIYEVCKVTWIPATTFHGGGHAPAFWSICLDKNGLSFSYESHQLKLVKRADVTDFDTYQKVSRLTKKYEDHVKTIYPTLGLAGEAGEVCEKVKKVLRDSDGIFSSEKKEEIKKELGDVLWYISNICTDLDISMADVAKMNIEKLFSRKARGELGGSGDNR